MSRFNEPAATLIVTESGLSDYRRHFMPTMSAVERRSPVNDTAWDGVVAVDVFHTQRALLTSRTRATIAGGLSEGNTVLRNASWEFADSASVGRRFARTE